MRVAELVDLLSTFPPDFRVVIREIAVHPEEETVLAADSDIGGLVCDEVGQEVSIMNGSDLEVLLAEVADRGGKCTIQHHLSIPPGVMN